MLEVYLAWDFLVDFFVFMLNKDDFLLDLYVPLRFEKIDLKFALRIYLHPQLLLILLVNIP